MRNNRVLFGALLLGILLLAGDALAATYYVDSAAGSDANAGNSETAAWKTLAKVNGHVLAPGDRLLFKRGGTWNGTFRPQGSGTAASKITLGAYGTGALPVIDAAGGEDAVVLRNLSHVTLEHFEITNPATDITRRARGVFILADQPGVHEGVIVRNNYIHHIDGAVTQSGRGMNGAIFTDATRLDARLRNLLIENNTIRDITVRGFSGNQGTLNANALETLNEGLTIRGNLIDNTGCDAIRIIAWKNALIEHNTLLRAGANTRGYEAAWIAAAFPQQSVDTVWQYNEIAYTAPTIPTGAGDLDSQPFDIDHHCGGTHVFQYNYTHDNAGGFFLFMGNMVDRGEGPSPFVKAVIRYNVSENDGVGVNRLFEIHDGGGRRFDVEVYNNTFYYSAGTMTIQLKGSAPGFAFWNNAFIAPAGSYSDSGGVLYSNNLYHDHEPPAFDAYSVRVDPRMVEPGAGGDGRSTAQGYRLQDASPVVATGRPVADNGGLDFWGNRAALGVADIGAFASSRPGTHRFVTTAVAVSNGGFEEGTIGTATGFTAHNWAGSPVMSRDSTVRYQGVASLKIVNYSAGDRGAFATSAPVPVTVGQTQRFSVKVRTQDVLSDYTGTGSGGASLVVLYRNSAGSAVGSRLYGPGVVGTSNDWASAVFEYRAPPTAASATVHVALQGTGTAWFDDLKVEQRGFQPRGGAEIPIPNAGLESGTTYPALGFSGVVWAGSSQFSRDAPSFRGGYALGIHQQTSVDRGAVTTNLDVSPGRTHTFSAFVQTTGVNASYTGTGPKGAALAIQYYNSTGASIGSRIYSTGIATASDWRLHQLETVAPANAVRVRLYLILHGPGTARFDELTLWQR